MSAFVMPEPSIGRESYLHRAAKEVLARWLRDSVNNYGLDLSPLSARPNRGGTSRGILIEYPIATDGAGAAHVWDELGWPGWDEATHWEGGAPTAAELIAAGIQVACVCDVAIWHKGSCRAAVEVVHRHPTPAWKTDFLKRHDIEVYEISAHWIMWQSAKPASLAVRRIA